MRLIKVGLANIDTTVGAFDSNMKRVWEFAQKMSEQRCTVGAFQEQVIGGYAAEDLVHWTDFVTAQEEKLLEFARKTRELPYKTVFVLGLTRRWWQSLQLCCSCLQRSSHRNCSQGKLPLMEFSTKTELCLAGNHTTFEKFVGFLWRHGF